jgi:hypothetical protein
VGPAEFLIRLYATTIRACKESLGLLLKGIVPWYKMNLRNGKSEERNAERKT